MKVEPIVRQSLADVVVQRLRGLIDREQLQAGDPLPPERDLLQQLQVSRPVLREAIARLESIGLLTARRGQAAFHVAERAGLASCVQMVQSAVAIGPKDLLKYAEVRWGIECYAARRAAELATPADLAELESLLEQMDRPEQSYEESLRLDFRFHRKLIDITGNEVLQNLIEVIHAFVSAGMGHTTPKPRDRGWSRPLHQAILDGVRSANPDAAEEAMRHHMEAVVRRLQAAAKRPARPAKESGRRESS